MKEKILMKGNEAIGEGAIKAGCIYFFGYPITPQNELPHYMAKRLPEVNGVFLQAESEVAAINMVYGAAATGKRVMTSSASPGISLKSEGISYLAAAELPAVIVNIMRGGPGLGGIQSSQSDYFQATKGGGHGDYRNIVLAPSTVQEMYDYTKLAFDLADKYRNPAMILGDGVLGQMMEPVELDNSENRIVFDKAWAATGKMGRSKPNVIDSFFLEPLALERHNFHLAEKYSLIRQNEQRWEAILVEDAELILVAYGTSSRVARSVVDRTRKEGFKIGMIRPITLWPFPELAFERFRNTDTKFLVVEMSMGQMVEDVKLALNDGSYVSFYGRTGGVVPSPKEVYEQVLTLLGKKEVA
ncbi:MAG TPA: 3-methyl-2-oxobutanoate dehydrogenase subunit VorB [Clostridia bacterium]|nr:3-methyl-2-oxobutanoate dehydrogenase subunit VorB [Clostridia bacterium]